MLYKTDDKSIIVDMKENGVEEDFLIVDKSIHQLSCLVSTIIKTQETKTVFGDLDIFLENQMTIYEEKKCISKKIRLVCKNCIEELRK
jgi:hypothetical protein